MIRRTLCCALGVFRFAGGQEGGAVAVPLFRIFMMAHVGFKLRCDGSLAVIILVASIILRPTMTPMKDSSSLFLLLIVLSVLVYAFKATRLLI